ncbi:MAG: NgoFVII family restriction endonuclease [Cytophagales bacterium]|nr:NgoFVII family restriction endonuclease [Cytophagales bacterium]
MYTSSSDSEIYIGQKAGKDLYNALSKAKKSIKIISPYLTASLVSELVRLQKEGIDIQLITSDNIEDYYPNQKKESILYEVVTQVRKTSKAKKAQRKMLNTLSMVFTVVSAVIAVAMLISIFYYNKDNNAQYYTLGIAFLGFVAAQVARSKSNDIRVFYYSYKTIFPIKVYYSPYNRDVDHSNKFFIHSKVYVIDENIAFLGSLNFTSKGLKSNYETCIKVRDRKAVYEISKEFDNLFEDKTLAQVDFNMVGKHIYKEAKN